jgi:transposase
MKTVTASPDYGQQIEALSIEIFSLKEANIKLEALVKYYEGQLLLLKRRQFGASSERICEGQLSLLGEVEITPPPPEIEEVTITRKKRIGKREEDLANLLVVRVEYEIPEEERTCPECAAPMNDIGVSIRREIEIIPAQAIVKEHAIHSYACQSSECKEKNDKTTIITADSPKPLISGSLASPSLVAHIASQKYSMGLPLYRIEKGFQYDGINISRQNMSGWVIKCYQMYLVSIYLLLKTFLLEESYLHADETTVQVLREPNRPAKTKSYEWVYRTGRGAKHKIVIYDYKETRRQEHPQEFLGNFKGFLNTDGYQAYKNLPSDIVIVGCWAHARRYFENLWKTIPEDKREGTDAQKGLQYINALFKLERDFAKLSPEERYKARLEKSKPIADAFFSWVDSIRALPKGLLGEAVTYAKNQRIYLNNVFLDGSLEISNNRCERSVKPFVQGRKAWLFSCTPDGAEASSALFSIIETAKENGLNPFQYVKFLLETLPYQTSGTNLENFLPWSDTLPDWCHTPKKICSE